MSTTSQSIESEALKILQRHPGGMQWQFLKDEIAKGNPSWTKTSISSGVMNLINGQQILRGARGVLGLPGVSGLGGAPQGGGLLSGQGIGESHFYRPFAQWLIDSDEATTAVPLGAPLNRSRWSNPDVVGIFKAKAGDLFRFQPELISAEIKADDSQSVVAFGQAISYRLFSHRTFIVTPKPPVADHVRLESLCDLFGIGYVTFDLNPEDPKFNRIVPARRFDPDMRYVNEFASNLYRADRPMFDSLFS